MANSADFSASKSSPSVAPDHVNQQTGQEWSRVEPLITPEQLIQRHLFGIPLVSAFPNPVTGKRDVMTEDSIQTFIIRAVSKIELETNLVIFPVQFKEKVPFDRTWWEHFGHIKVEHRPISSVESITFTPANEAVILNLPLDWAELSNAHKGQINIIPLIPATTAGFVQAATGSNGSAFLTVFFGKTFIPALVQVIYTCGYPNRTLPIYLNELIGMEAAIDILSQIAITYKYTSYGLGLDGTNQNVSGPGPAIYEKRIEHLKAEKEVIRRLIKNIYGQGIISTGL